MNINNIITLSDQGLALDTLGKNDLHFSANMFVKAQNILLFCDKSSVTMYDLNNHKILNIYSIEDTKELKLSNCGVYAAALTYCWKLYVFDASGIIKDFINIRRFEISSNFIIFSETNNLQIFNLQDKNKMDCIIKSSKCVLAGSNIIYKTAKNAKGEISLVFEKLDIPEFKRVYNFPDIIDFEIRANDDVSQIVILITTGHSFESYYHKPSAYLLNCNDGTLNEITLVDNVLFCEFVGNDIVICCGHQPSDVVVIDSSLKIKKRYQKGIRNKVYFNPHRNLVCFAGFDNLSGIIEVYSHELLTKLKVLGASEIVWSPCGSYFIVATTDKLKVNNGITVYDYFGRIVCEKKFDKLITCCWYGPEENFTELERPEVLKIPVESTYVPPHLRNCENLPESVKKTKKPKHVKKDAEKKFKNKKTENIIKEKPKEINIEDLEKELVDIKELKVRITNGDSISMEDMNKILREDEIIGSIKKLEIETNKN